MPLSVCADSASRGTRSFRPTSLATRTRSWLPTSCSNSLTMRMTSLLLLAGSERPRRAMRNSRTRLDIFTNGELSTVTAAQEPHAADTKASRARPSSAIRLCPIGQDMCHTHADEDVAQERASSDMVPKPRIRTRTRTVNEGHAHPSRRAAVSSVWSWSFLVDKQTPSEYPNKFQGKSRGGQIYLSVVPFITRTSSLHVPSHVFTAYSLLRPLRSRNFNGGNACLYAMDSRLDVQCTIREDGRMKR